MKRMLTACAILLVAQVALGASTLTYVSFYSPSLGANRMVGVYLPNGYNPAGSQRYPVIYYLHGFWDDQTSNSTDLKGALDELIGSGAIRPVIVIKPSGAGGPFAGTAWANSALYGRYEDYVVSDLVPWADGHYLTIADRHKRALMGHSGGAIGTFTIGFTHPELFQAVAAHSAFTNWDRIRGDIRTQLLAENAGPPYDYNPYGGMYTQAVFSLAGAYTPNLSNPPYQVDLPFDSWGGVVESVVTRWKTHNPDVLLAGVSPGLWPAIYFDCGTMDEFYMHQTNLDLVASFNTMGVPHTFESYVGHHADMLAQRYRISLRFLDAAMITTDVLPLPLPKQLAMLPNSPDPFNPSTDIRYVLPQQAPVTVTVYDARGRRVRDLYFGEQGAGLHGVRWDGKDNQGTSSPSGMYIARVESPTGRGSEKLTLLK